LIFCYGNELKFTYEHLQFQKFFRLASARHKGENRKGEGMGGEEKEREGRGGKKEKEKGGEAGELAPKHKNLTPPMLECTFYISQN
jgi:hypothetical protein